MEIIDTEIIINNIGYSIGEVTPKPFLSLPEDYKIIINGDELFVGDTWVKRNGEEVVIAKINSIQEYWPIVDNKDSSYTVNGIRLSDWTVSEYDLHHKKKRKSTIFDQIVNELDPLPDLDVKETLFDSVLLSDSSSINIEPGVSQIQKAFDALNLAIAGELYDLIEVKEVEKVKSLTAAYLKLNQIKGLV